jgi:signal transduction histidine kinase
VRCYAETSGGKRKFGIDVHDTGPGITPEDLPHIFERFYKSKDSRGSGLGLTIARNLVLAHGGEILAQSEAGRGTTIRIRLPLAS